MERLLGSAEAEQNEFTEKQNDCNLMINAIGSTKIVSKTRDTTYTVANF
jgi:hypothetical protein